ncbi:hypothetical protein FA13DRAFT_112514 [Coprinellus micaceus]|uniref:Uncharacterized protein n=1 Tax=Coprinellus micaceus TaxID=71717 RepID=A0A4Y7THY5_COPMI|nr:hypothetical protein FA13DRAFT_112514 [Coprinellus micaceus]
MSRGERGRIYISLNPNGSLTLGASGRNLSEASLATEVAPATQDTGHFGVSLSNHDSSEQGHTRSRRVPRIGSRGWLFSSTFRFVL